MLPIDIARPDHPTKWINVSIGLSVVNCSNKSIIKAVQPSDLVMKCVKDFAQNRKDLVSIHFWFPIEECETRAKSGPTIVHCIFTILFNFMVRKRLFSYLIYCIYFQLFTVELQWLEHL